MIALVVTIGPALVVPVVPVARVRLAGRRARRAALVVTIGPVLVVPVVAVVPVAPGRFAGRTVRRAALVVTIGPVLVVPVVAVVPVAPGRFAGRTVRRMIVAVPALLPPGVHLARAASRVRGGRIVPSAESAPAGHVEWMPAVGPRTDGPRVPAMVGRGVLTGPVVGHQSAAASGGVGAATAPPAIDRHAGPAPVRPAPAVPAVPVARPARRGGLTRGVDRRVMVRGRTGVAQVPRRVGGGPTPDRGPPAAGRRARTDEEPDANARSVSATAQPG